MKIKPIPDEVINKIAAGEVVERPANVLKELIENSIDANANKIEIFIEKGGKKLISVKDNGEGIFQEDMINAVKRHFSSKIEKEEDLYSLKSYGFRGEALASISSVSKLRITSRTIQQPVGSQLYIEGGKFKYLNQTASPLGTKIDVEDLFFNTPARLKFLKSDNTELQHIINIFSYYAILHSDKYFRLVIDKKEVYNLYPSTLEDRIGLLFSSNFAKDLVVIDYENEKGKIYGFVDINLKNKKNFIFVNKRPVKNQLISKTVKNLIGEKGYILFFEFPSFFVDYNVHPSKMEIKFSDDTAVSNLIKEAFSISLNPFKKERKEISFSLNQQISKYKTDKFDILGQIEDSFIVGYYKGDLYILDQHVVNERILYEKFIKDSKEFLSSKNLKNPIKLELSPQGKFNFEILKENLEKVGYRFDENMNILSIPEKLTQTESYNILIEILESGEKDIEKLIKKIAEKLSCHYSITAGDKLRKEEAEKLIKEWIETENPILCPHGRPIYYKIPVEEIKKYVGRS
ncbi:DNA mismatch repair endonuclease MutL [Venenivibrio stagnispumantis]|uniref:DNA mismatch repair protein MutL n=1 Tax=Venenivibrio stagnispumantis TaxID=407998 RepID=A0AA45WP03_9AQUI|nr:DNA mismatch repair endonuclease MutL [Venenivibrio stagnispumantis]MCW4573803.1 DNA mismatch repair endonuclease MutL [Venenivibrio stagnispumantis]SMP20140.1 DNA mismatch repair protein MutL [Venenivibrio stagnispumantis]